MVAKLKIQPKAERKVFTLNDLLSNKTAKSLLFLKNYVFLHRFLNGENGHFTI